LNALIIRPGALGDTLMLISALVDLREKARITFVGRQPGVDFVRDYVFRAMDLESSGWHRLFMERPDTRGLPVSHIDIVVAFFSDEDGRVHHNLKSYLPHTPVHLFASFPPKGEKIHVARYLSECLRSAGLPINPDNALEIAFRGALCKTMGVPRVRDKIVLHPGSGDPRKNHPPDLLLTLLAKLCQEPVLQEKRPVLVLGPAEESLRPFFKKNVHSIKAEIQDCPDKELLIELLGEAALYLGHDSGITHLAAMLGAPTIAFFRESDAYQWRPLGPCVKVTHNKKAGPELIEEVINECLPPLLSCLE
jgi:heptosyltransferase-3